MLFLTRLAAPRDRRTSKGYLLYSILISLYILSCYVILAIGSCYFQAHIHNLVWTNAKQVEKAFELKSLPYHLFISKEKVEIYDGEFFGSLEGIIFKFLLAIPLFVLSFLAAYFLRPSTGRGAFLLALFGVTVLWSIKLNPIVRMNPTILLGTFLFGGVFWLIDSIYSTDFEQQLEKVRENSEGRKMLFDANSLFIKCVLTVTIAGVAVLIWNISERIRETYVYGPLIKAFTVWIGLIAVWAMTAVFGGAIRIAGTRINKILETNWQSSKKQ